MLNALANCILKIEHGVKNTNRPEDRVIGEKFMATLAPILAAAVIRSNELEDLNTFERLVGHSFLIDPGPFGTFYEDWKDFKDQCERLVVSGMTVNERLFALGLLDAFEQFVDAKEWDECREILRRVYLDEDNVDAIINKHKSG
jgi:hypothetical protein